MSSSLIGLLEIYGGIIWIEFCKLGRNYIQPYLSIHWIYADVGRCSIAMIVPPMVIMLVIRARMIFIVVTFLSVSYTHLTLPTKA